MHQSVLQNHSRRHVDGRPSSESIKEKLEVSLYWVIYSVVSAYRDSRGERQSHWPEALFRRLAILIH